MNPGTVPILSCADAAELEKRLLDGDPDREWSAMSAAGVALGKAVRRDSAAFRPASRPFELFVLAGKGHNAGDALIAARTILAESPASRVRVAFLYGERSLKPLVSRAWRELQGECRGRVETVAAEADVPGLFSERPADIVIDGILGMQFRPPIRPPGDRWVGAINALGSELTGLRVAVDLPSGLGDESAEAPFMADFTYATGIAKQPLFVPGREAVTGRIRFLDIGFFDETAKGSRTFSKSGTGHLATPALAGRMARPRPASSDKRTFGHAFLVGGSRSMPGALAMAVEAAVRSGAGLVTAFVPESVASVLAARRPEAMWVPMPATPDGGLALEGFHLVARLLERADAVAIGPGLGRERESHLLAARILEAFAGPVVLDADALFPEVVASVSRRSAGASPVVMTPHAGEFARIGGDSGVDRKPDEAVAQFVRSLGGSAIVLLKGPVTRIGDGSRKACVTAGGPVLARGGSGDLLCGMLAARLGDSTDPDPWLTTLRVAQWHGMAADAAARARGESSLATTEVLDFLHEAAVNGR